MSDPQHEGSDHAKPSGFVRCVIVTPESTILDTLARSVSLPLFDGQRGVARGHAPFIGRLGAGEMRIMGEQGMPNNAVRRIFVEGGFVEAGHDTVTIITHRALPANAINVAHAREELVRLRASKAAGDDAIVAKMHAEEVARSMLRAAENTH